VKRVLPLILISVSCAWSQVNENNLPSTSTLSDTDKVRVVQGGVSKSAPAGVVRDTTVAHILDRTIVGGNILQLPTPSALTYLQINPDNSVSLLTGPEFLASIGAGSATMTIREIDGDPNVSFSELRVPDGTLSVLGPGIVQLTYGTGTGTGGGTWGSITGTLSAQTDLQSALDAKQSLDSDLTAIAAAGTQTYGISLLGTANVTAAQTLLGLVPGTNVQPFSLHLTDLADGTLTGSKVGTGIDAGNITTGFLSLANGGLGVNANGFGNGLLGLISGATADIDTMAKFSSALGVTGTPSGSTVLRGDGTWGAAAGGAITVREEDSTPSVASVSEIRVTNGSLTDNGSGSISLNLTGGAGGGDAISDISSSTSQQIALFNGTTGKHLTNYTGTGILSATSGVIGTASTTGSGSVVLSNGPTLVGPQLGSASASSLTSPIFQSNASDPADTGIVRLGNNQAIAWESSPTGTDKTLLVDASNILIYNGTFSATAFEEGSTPVPNATDNLSFFAPTTSAQLNSIITDNNGSGLLVFDTSPTLTTPTVSGVLTLNNGLAYADASMAANSVDTGEMNNTKSVAADTTFTFSATPAAGSIFGLQLTNSDVSPHTITIPSSKSDALGGAARTAFTLAAGSSVYLKWRHEGSGVYTIWGEPSTISDLAADLVPDTAADYVMTWDASAGSHKKVALNLLPSGSGDSILVNTAPVVDADFQSTGDISFVAAGSGPTVVTANVNSNSIALTTDTTGDYVANLTAGLGLTGTVTGEGSTPTIALDTSALLSGNHTLGSGEVRFGSSGIIFEGSSADTIEGYLSAANPTSSDKTWTLPDASGTIILSGHTFTGNVTGTLGAGGTTTLTITGNAVDGSNIAMGSDAQGDILYYNGTDYARLAAGTAGSVLQTGGAGANPSWVNSASSSQTLLNKDLTSDTNVLPAEMIVAASDETTALTTGTAKVTFRMPYAMTVTAVRASLTNAQASGSLLAVDINEAGTTILSTKLSFNNGSKTTVGAATPAVISDSTLADDAEVTVDIDTVGTSGASGLKVTLIGTR
jgi:hypothetical protein